MNLFVILDGKLVTPHLSDSILAGVTRDSILTLAREWGITVEERPIGIAELRDANKRGGLHEVFGSGTAAVVSPVAELALGDEKLSVGDGQAGPIARRLYDEIIGIQRGTIPDRHGWLMKI